GAWSKLAVREDDPGVPATRVHSIYPGNEGRRLIRLIPDADGVGFASKTLVANIDIETFRREGNPCPSAQGDIVGAGCVPQERLKTGGCVGLAGVKEERPITVGRVGLACGDVIERPITGGRVADAGCDAIERVPTVGRVVCAGR